MKKLHILMISGLCMLLINSCKKSDSTDAGQTPGKATYHVRMTDAPGPYEQVNVDVRAVEITGNGGTQVLLNAQPGIYNLLAYANGLDTLIASGTIYAGKVEQVRLILGPENTVVVDGDTFPLETPSAEQSGLKIQVHQDIVAGAVYTILLDFDANQSIVKTGNGKYKLKPVIRTISTATGGSIKGSIAPIGVTAIVTATDGINSYSSAVTAGGNFMIMGLPAGTYDITITPAAPYSVAIKSGVMVSAGAITDLGLISL